MSEPRRYRLYLSGAKPQSNWHRDPATSKQVARLRYLGVAPRDSFTKAQAGALIDRTEADPGFRRAIEKWHRDKYRLHPDLYSKVEAFELPLRVRQSAPIRLPMFVAVAVVALVLLALLACWPMHSLTAFFLAALSGHQLRARLLVPTKH